MGCFLGKFQFVRCMASLKTATMLLSKVAVHANEAPHLYHSHQHHHHQHQFLDPGFDRQDQKKLSKKNSTAVLVRCMSNGSEAEQITENSSSRAEDASDASKPVATLAYMVLVGHGIHNFIDGMSIGAAFASDKVLGISLSLAVFIEEIPHGLGDFAILLNSGMRKKQAVLFNFLASCPCFVGLVAGIKLSEVMNAAPWILGIAGGIFIYISLADMLPEMKEAQENSDAPLMTFFIQNVGIICGVVIIVVMAVYGEGIQI